MNVMKSVLFLKTQILVIKLSFSVLATNELEKAN